MKFNSLFNFFRFPPPTHFGADRDDALEIEDFKHSDQSYTWEKYYQDLKNNFPKKYFLLKEIPDWFKYNIYLPISLKLKDMTYFVKCHITPNKRYHYLKLSQPKTNTDDDYTYGWIDSDKQILFACMNIVVNYIEKERTDIKDYLSFLKEEADKYNNLSEDEKKSQYNYQDAYDRHKKVLDIYLWWTKDRKECLKQYDNCLNNWSELRKIDKANSNIKFEELNKLEQEIKEKEQEMLHSLIELRDCMWT